MSIIPAMASKDANNQRATVVARTILSWLDRTTGFLAAICLVAIVTDVLAGVISRYVFNRSFTWTETGGQWLWAYLIFLGITLAHRYRRHVSLDLLTRHLPKNFHPTQFFLIDLIVAYTTINMLFHSVDLIRLVGGTDVVLSVPNWLKFGAIPVTAGTGLVYLALRGFDEKKNPLSNVAAILVAGLLFYLTTLALNRPISDSPSLVMGIAFLTTLLLGVPVAFAMLFSAFLAIFGGNLLPGPAVVQNIVNGSSSFLLLAIPLFILSGELMNIGGLSTRLYDFAGALVGNARGGLAQINVLMSFLFGGISGSSGSDAALDSKIIVPQMFRQGYPMDFSCAITAASSVLTNIVPPSIAMLIYSSITGASVIRLFIGGILPAVILMTLLMIMVYMISCQRGYGRSGEKATFWKILKAFFNAVPVLSLAVLILVGMRFGVVTPTEAAVIAVIYAFLLGCVVYRHFGWRDIYSGLVTVATEAAIIGFLVGVAGPFSFVLLSEQVPQGLIEKVLGHTANPQIILVLIVLVGLLMGTALDLSVSLVILVPLVYPLMSHLGVDVIHFGVVITITLLFGGLTPPVGILVFIPASITNTPATAIFREITPFLIVLVVGLFIITLFPSIVLTLVRWLV